MTGHAKERTNVRTNETKQTTRLETQDASGRGCGGEPTKQETTGRWPRQRAKRMAEGVSRRCKRQLVPPFVDVSDLPRVKVRCYDAPTSSGSSYSRIEMPCPRPTAADAQRLRRRCVVLGFEDEQRSRRVVVPSTLVPSFPAGFLPGANVFAPSARPDTPHRRRSVDG